MLQAVIFDFDGVITDSEMLHLRAFNAVLGRFDIEIEESDYFKNYLGLNDFECFTQVSSDENLGLREPQVRELIPEKNRVFNEMSATQSQIIPGVREFIDMLAANRVPMAICSGALMVEIELILNKSGLKDYFKTVVAADHVKRGKPDPEGFLLALENLNKVLAASYQPDQCVVIEDSHWGLEAAVAAGMHPVAVTNSYGADQLQSAERVVENLSSLKIEDLRQLCV